MTFLWINNSYYKKIYFHSKWYFFIFSLEIFNQNMIYKYYLVFMLQGLFSVIYLHTHIHTCISIHIFIYNFLQFSICQFELWNHITVANRASNSFCIKKDSIYKLMMIIRTSLYSENITIANIKLQWQGSLCNVALYTSSIFHNISILWKCCQRNECSKLLSNLGITMCRAPV